MTNTTNLSLLNKNKKIVILLKDMHVLCKPYYSGSYIEFISLHFIKRNILAIEIAISYVHQTKGIKLGETIGSFY